MTHRVVVYDPITYSLLEGGLLFPIIASAAVFIISMVILAKIEPHVRLKFGIRAWDWKSKAIGYAMWGIAGVLAVLTFNHFAI